MKKQIKGLLGIVLVLCLLIVPFCSISAAAAIPKDEITPLYNNVSNATANLGISDNGKMTINYSYVGSSGITTKAVITTYIEKKVLGLFWTRVDIGTTNDEWVDTINNYKYTGSRTHQLSSSGTYRVTIKFKIYGTGGSADEIERQIKASY